MEATLNTSDWIEIFSILTSTVISIVSIGIAVFTLRQTNQITREANRANIVIYVTKERNDPFQTLVIKNFGNSSGVILDMQSTPNLSHDGTDLDGISSLINCKNIYLAPGQSIKSLYDLKNIDNFEVAITYKTLNRIYSETYQIDLSYRDAALRGNTKTKNTQHALEVINQSIRSMSDKFD